MSIDKHYRDRLKEEPAREDSQFLNLFAAPQEGAGSTAGPAMNGEPAVAAPLSAGGDNAAVFDAKAAAAYRAAGIDPETRAAHNAIQQPGCKAERVEFPGLGTMNWCEKCGIYFGKDDACPSARSHVRCSACGASEREPCKGNCERKATQSHEAPSPLVRRSLIRWRANVAWAHYSENRASLSANEEKELFLDTVTDTFMNAPLESASSHVGASEDAALTYKAFWDRHAKGSLACPSCLLCGRQRAREQWQIKHAELPDIYICAPCVDAARSSIEPMIPAGYKLVPTFLCNQSKPKPCAEQCEGCKVWEAGLQSWVSDDEKIYSRADVEALCQIAVNAYKRGQNIAAHSAKKGNP